MTKLRFGVCALLTFAAAPSAYSMQCNLAGVTQQVSAEGLAEPVGEIYLNCGGGPPNGVLSGSFQIFLGRNVANVTDVGKYVGITLSQEFPGGIFIDQPATIKPSGSSILFEDFQIVMDAQGSFSIRFGGIRADTDATTLASLQFTGNQVLLLRTRDVTVALAQPTLLATHIGAAAAGLGPVLSSPPDFDTMIAAHVPMATSRVTEGWTTAFAPRKDNETNGTRIMIRLPGVPEGARIFAPDALAGTGTIQPTQSGDMGGYPTSGLYAFSSTGSLFMSRVRSTQPDGSGGYPAVYPSYVGAQPLTGVSEASVANGVAYLVYETMDANPMVRESVQIPIWVVLPTDRYVTPAVVRPVLTMAPLSEQEGSVAGAPIPRYRAAIAATDCELMGDCAAPYFPQMTVFPPANTTVTAAAGSGNISAYIPVRNTGGSLLEWRASVRYRSAATGWVTVSPASGFSNATIRYDVFPAKLVPGHYEAEIVVQQVGSPTGTDAVVVIPVVLNVTAAIPPPVPLPSITAIVDAANHWPMAEAPGSLVVITGTNFGENTSITIGGKPATILRFTPTEMLVQVALDTPIGRTEVLPANGSLAGPTSALQIVPVAPATYFVLNSEGEYNSEAQPAEAGKAIQVLMSGIRGAAQPLSVKIHDRYLDVEFTPTDQVGVNLVKFLVPDDFPTMPSVVVVCGVPVAGGDAVCSHPRDIWVKEAVR